MASLQRILYVEDEPDIQAVAKIALENVGGFEIQVCNSADEALADAVSFAPDLLLLDVMMPDMDGQQALEKLWEIPEIANVPAIFMTARVQSSEVAEYKTLGALDVIAKPFDPMLLADKIKEIWQKNNK